MSLVCVQSPQKKLSPAQPLGLFAAPLVRLPTADRHGAYRPALPFRAHLGEIAWRVDVFLYTVYNCR